jgi:signal transduction histidine kinase/phage shock protein PspC (stress-responsive transcriptional regulator)
MGRCHTTKPALETIAISLTVSRRDDHTGARRLTFRRSAQNRVVAGVAAGLAERWGLDPAMVRAAFVALCAAGGAGVIAYLLAWAISAEPQPQTAATPPRTLTPAAYRRRVIGLLCIVAGALLVLRDVGLWFGDRLAWPLVLGVLGSAVIWMRSDERERWARLAGRDTFLGSRAATVRIVAGGLLVAAGMGVFLAGNQVFSATGEALVAMAVTASGILLILGPWVFRLARQASDDRRERIRSEERAEMAAHLHDSVLHTLALIQRSGAASPDVVSLARTQERELRAWLQGQPPPAEAQTLGGAVEAMAARVEQMHHVAVESVVVGDCAVDERVRALLMATQEAAVNAARHSGAAKVDVYVEVEGDKVTAFVRDRGRGFDPDVVPQDRRGIRESIVGRLRRSGGSAAVSSAPGEGTQVQMQVARESS